MELKIKYRYYVSDGAGALVRASGREELLERVLYKLSVRRGIFPLAQELGSVLRLLWREKGERSETAAKRYVAEALAEEAGVTVSGVSLEQKGDLLLLRAARLYEGETLEVSVRIGGE